MEQTSCTAPTSTPSRRPVRAAAKVNAHPGEWFDTKQSRRTTAQIIADQELEQRKQVKEQNQKTQAQEKIVQELAAVHSEVAQRVSNNSESPALSRMRFSLALPLVCLKISGRKCDVNGNPLPSGTPLTPHNEVPYGDYSPFKDATKFLLADFLFQKAEMSGDGISYLMELWAFEMLKHDDFGPFSNADHLYTTIDAIKHGDVPWHAMDVSLGDTSIRHCPHRYFDDSGKRRWTNYFSGNFAWRHCDKIFADDPSMEGSLYVPAILGSDKTTVSVATGHVEYHPLYLSIGNIHSAVRRAHRNTVIPIGFLAIPKPDRQDDNDPEFRAFKKKLFHQGIATIFDSLKPSMTTPTVKHCPDSYYRRVIYDLGAYTADYPEQVYLTGIACHQTSYGMNLVSMMMSWCAPTFITAPAPSSHCQLKLFTQDFPCADIHELISPDILHQLIKGTFKDHLVEWVEAYLVEKQGKERAKKIMDEIDRRVAAAPTFPGLRRFPQGLRFKQWTGDDSKVLMKVYLPAIAEFVEPQVVQCLAPFMDFCYTVRLSEGGESDIARIEEKLAAFQQLREVFITANVRESVSLPRQHSLCHYPILIQEFSAPNGLCSSITESRHITAFKKPWSRSNRYNTLGQMLLTNQRLEKLHAAHADFAERNMLLPLHAPAPTCIPDPIPDDEDDNKDTSPVDDEWVTGTMTLPNCPEPTASYPRGLSELAESIGLPDFPCLAQKFLYHQLYPGAEEEPNEEDLPKIHGRVHVYHSATATFYAPSDQSDLQGMRCEIIRSTPSWHSGPARRDCVFLVEDEELPARLLFSFKFEEIIYPCILIDRFKQIDHTPDSVTGLWKVQPKVVTHGRNSERLHSVEHLDSVLRAAHLMPVYGYGTLPRAFDYQ
ncbi:hypothetical protein K488DRAFT_80584 [Vararia minispora EC-137]|uniref:Uncharacterized protein n=1 Tax=Vararia minispora EC-137 TaxID=1314806 RepID=A0ACB8QAJ8_9AGAM|nr:hypothetical protein K488DRAFT_80584 [Vararia minispora EC-137]